STVTSVQTRPHHVTRVVVTTTHNKQRNNEHLGVGPSPVKHLTAPSHHFHLPTTNAELVTVNRRCNHTAHQHKRVTTIPITRTLVRAEVRVCRKIHTVPIAKVQQTAAVVI